MTKNLKELLVEVTEKGGSDLHLNVDLPPQVRIDGNLVPLSDEPLTGSTAQALCYECLNQEQVMRLEAERSIDFHSVSKENLATVQIFSGRWTPLPEHFAPFPMSSQHQNRSV